MNPLMLLFLALLPLLAFAGGVVLARSRGPQPLTSTEKKELRSYRNLVGELTSLAGEHSALGDHFAVIALQKINEHRKELQ